MFTSTQAKKYADARNVRAILVDNQTTLILQVIGDLVKEQAKQGNYNLKLKKRLTVAELTNMGIESNKKYQIDSVEYEKSAEEILGVLMIDDDCLTKVVKRLRENGYAVTVDKEKSVIELNWKSYPTV